MQVSIGPSSCGYSIEIFISPKGYPIEISIGSQGLLYTDTLRPLSRILWRYSWILESSYIEAPSSPEIVDYAGSLGYSRSILWRFS